MSLSKQNTFEFSSEIADTIAKNNSQGALYLFAAEATDKDARSFVNAQINGLESHLWRSGSSIQRHFLRELFVPCGDAYALNKEGIAKFDDDRIHHIDMTDSIVLSVHFMRWFVGAGMRLLAMSLPAFKKRVLMETNITNIDGRGINFSWFACEQLFYLSKMVFFAENNKLKLVRSISHPSGTEVDFISKKRVWMDTVSASNDVFMEIASMRPRVLFSYEDDASKDLAVAQANLFALALAKKREHGIRTIAAKEIMVYSNSFHPKLSPKALSMAESEVVNNDVLFFDMTDYEDLASEERQTLSLIGIQAISDIINRAGGTMVVVQKSHRRKVVGEEKLLVPGWIYGPEGWKFGSYYFLATSEGTLQEMNGKHGVPAVVDFTELSKKV